MTELHSAGQPSNATGGARCVVRGMTEASPQNFPMAAEPGAAPLGQSPTMPQQFQMQPPMGNMPMQPPQLGAPSPMPPMDMQSQPGASTSQSATFAMQTQPGLSMPGQMPPMQFPAEASMQLPPMQLPPIPGFPMSQPSMQQFPPLQQGGSTQPPPMQQPMDFGSNGLSQLPAPTGGMQQPLTQPMDFGSNGMLPGTFPPQMPPQMPPMQFDPNGFPGAPSPMQPMPPFQQGVPPPGFSTWTVTSTWIDPNAWAATWTASTAWDGTDGTNDLRKRDAGAGTPTFSSHGTAKDTGAKETAAAADGHSRGH